MKLALVAVQLEVSMDVLASGDAYRAYLEATCARAVDDTGDADEILIVYPELAGHLALLALAPPAAHKAKTLGAALAASAVRKPFEVLRGVATTRVLDPKQAVLAAIAPDGDRYWRGVFGPLARKHGAYVVAGSHLRLAPNGDLTNASCTFAPDGRLLSTTDKVNLVPGMEDRAPKALGLARGESERLPIIETRFGKLTTLICYDAFREPHSIEERFVPLAPRVQARGGCTVVANPASNPWRWTQPWPPARFAGRTRDVSERTRELQWHGEGLPASLAEVPFARWGVTAHLVGKVLDLEFDGQSEIVEREGGTVRRLARAERPDRGGHIVATVTC